MMKLMMCLLALPCAFPAALASIVPLPEEFHSNFGHTIADRLYLTDGSGGNDVWVDVKFRNRSSKEINFKWYFKANGATANGDSSFETVSYQPTAVCKKAGFSDTLYVAGWSERTGSCLIEEWVFQTPFSIASVPNPNGGPPSSELTLPVIAKTVVYSSTTLGPIYDLATNPFANTLWILAGDSPRSIWAFDFSTTSLSLLYSSSVMQQLADHHSLWVGMNTMHGFVIYSQPRRKWEPLSAFVEPYTVSIFRDSDLDGQVEFTESLLYGGFFSSYASKGWDLKYAAP